MPFVEAKCTNCGANLQVDNSKEAGICNHCGTAFITEKVINNYYSVTNISANTVNITEGSLENYFILAKNAQETSNNKEAILYYNKVLQINPNHYESLYGKAICSFYSSTMGNINSQELIFYTKKALIAFKDSDSYTKTDFGIDILNDFNRAVKTWVRLFEESYFECSNLKTSASAIIDYYKIALFFILELDNLISEFFPYTKETRFVNNWIILKDWGIYCCHKSFKRYSYEEYNQKGSFILRNPVRTEVFNHYQILLKNIKILDPSYTEKKPLLNHPVFACYIATSIYGSYNCPEVWVLRRYRDNVLNKNLLGRLFIKIYYFVSPKVIKIFGKSKWFVKFWRKKLDKKVCNLKRKGFEDTVYED